MKVQCPQCHNVQNAPAAFCAKCGVQFVVKPVRPKVNQKFIAIVFSFLLLGFMGLAWFNDSNKNSRTIPEKQSSATESHFITNQLKKDLLENYNSTTWYQNIKDVSVKGDIVEIKTNLISKNEKAGKICGGVSFLVYSYEGTTQDETIIVFGDRNNVLIRRKSIAEKCS
jgi:hypothetical protein